MKLDRSGPVMCFGEVLLRLSTAAGTRIASCSNFSAHVGGAEANVGALLAQLGAEVEMITVLPRSSLGDLCEAEIRRVGMRTNKVLRSGGRLGLYFLEPASSGGRIVYDREHSAFACNADQLDWVAVAPHARWLHLSGINLALGDKVANSALGAAEAMRSAGVPISFDVNHRASLWEGRTLADFDRVRALTGRADVLFASPHDISRVLGIDLRTGTREDRRAAAEAAFAAFESLQFVASTARSTEAGRPTLSARIDSRDLSEETAAAPLGTVIDRIGSGDAFAGAVIDGILRGAPLQEIANQGLAAAVLKHRLHGDRWIGTRAELEAFDPFVAGDVQR
jgi:2-dehydro-3-deoxygluconokinase